jgi:uncharacterized protein (TIGR03545 family)
LFRGGVVLLLGAILWMSKDSLLRWTLVHSAQAMTGAQVEIGRVKTELAAGRIRLIDVQIANPCDPMKNLLQTDEAIIELDTANLLRRRLVIDHGTLHNLQLDTPRVSAGDVEQSAGRDGSIQWFPQDLRNQLRELGRRFLDCVEVRNASSPDKDLTLLRVAEEIEQQMSGRLAAVAESAKPSSDQIAQLAQQFDRDARNPLRESNRWQELAGQLPQVGSAVREVEIELARLRSQFAAELARLDAAREADRAAAGSVSRTPHFDAELLSQILVGPQQLNQIDSTLQWVEWLRRATPILPTASREPAAASAHRLANPPGGTRRGGVDVHYTPARPMQLWCQALSFDGAAIVAGKNYNIFGTIRDWSFPCQDGSEPISLEIRALGPSHVYLSAQFDRRNGRSIDRFHMVCPELQSSGQTLGDPKVVLVDSSPGRLDIEADLTITGGDVQGSLLLRHSETAVRIQNVHDLAGGPRMAQSLNPALAGVHQYETRIEFSGPLDHVTVACHCDLAPRIAAAAIRAAGSDVRDTASAVETRIEHVYAASMRRLGEEFECRYAALADQLQADLLRIERMQRLASNGFEEQRIRR